MALDISPRRLRRNLWRRGPYIIYFNGKDQRINQELVKTMQILAEKYKILTVYEVDWEKFLDFECGCPNEQINKVYMYRNGYEESTNLNPSREELEMIFFKCIEFVWGNRLEIPQKVIKKTDEASKNVYKKESAEKIQRILRLRRKAKYMRMQRKMTEAGNNLKEVISNPILKKIQNKYIKITPNISISTYNCYDSKPLNAFDEEYSLMNKSDQINNISKNKNFYSNSEKILSYYPNIDPINKIRNMSTTDLNTIKTLGNGNIVDIHENILKNKHTHKPSINAKIQSNLKIDKRKAEILNGSLFNKCRESIKSGLNQNSLQKIDIPKISSKNYINDYTKERIKEKIEKKIDSQNNKKDTLGENISSNCKNKCNSPIIKNECNKTKNNLPLDLTVKRDISKSLNEKPLNRETSIEPLNLSTKYFRSSS